MTGMMLDIDLQIALPDSTKLSIYLPTIQNFEEWIRAALSTQTQLSHQKPIELTLRIVEAEESQNLNNEYRDKQKPTNILSFPSDVPDFISAQQETLYLGDLIICATVLLEEAQQQQKQIAHHWAHICVHGVLHLLGYDHVQEQEAEAMEGLERIILHNIDVDDPYIDNTHLT